jgi:hypothetical protein
MKTLKTPLLLALILSTSPCAFAQLGAINFNNRVVGVFDAPVTLQFGQLGAGTIPRAAVQLLVVGAGGSLTPVGSPIGFRGTTDPLARYFDGGALDIPGTSPGETVTLRVRGWIGTSFETSGNNIGQSFDFKATLGGGILPPENLVNLKAFSIGTPEPTVSALAVVAALGGLVLRRARSQSRGA